MFGSGNGETPCLPDNDVDPRTRAKQLEDNRTVYRYTYRHLGGIPMAETVPRDQRFSLEFGKQIGELSLTQLENHVSVNFANIAGTDREGPNRFQELFDDHKIGDLGDLMRSVKDALSEGVHTKRPESLESYESIFRVIAPPPVVKHYASDAEFAWQRLAGANPMVIARVQRSLPDNFPLREDAFRRVAGVDDSLAAALAEGRLYMADYRLMDGLATGSYKGQQKHLWAPMAMFLRPRQAASSLEGFVPLAIQCGQKPGSDTPLFTPEDGHRWLMARNTVLVAEANYHQIISHVTRAHLFMEPFVVTTERQLAAHHPIKILLKPHYQFTLDINDHARRDLLAPGGDVDKHMAGTLEADVTLMERARKELGFDDAILGKHLESRGVEDVDTLPDYPYRDDGILIWKALHTFVKDYIGLYYHDDDHVRRDTELQAWRTELVAEDGGRVSGLSGIQSKDRLVDVLTQVIYQGSAHHAVVNFGQYPFCSYTPNMPPAGYAEAPRADTPDERASYLAMLPPVDAAYGWLGLMYQLSHVYWGRLGQYPPLYFKDHRVPPLAMGLETALNGIEGTIRERNRTRAYPFALLLPSSVPASINI